MNKLQLAKYVSYVILVNIITTSVVLLLGNYFYSDIVNTETHSSNNNVNTTLCFNQFIDYSKDFNWAVFCYAFVSILLIIFVLIPGNDQNIPHYQTRLLNFIVLLIEMFCITQSACLYQLSGLVNCNLNTYGFNSAINTIIVFKMILLHLLFLSLLCCLLVLYYIIFYLNKPTLEQLQAQTTLN